MKNLEDNVEESAESLREDADATSNASKLTKKADNTEEKIIEKLLCLLNEEHIQSSNNCIEQIKLMKYEIVTKKQKAKEEQNTNMLLKMKCFRQR